MVLELQVNKFFFNQVKEKTLKEDFRAIKKYWIEKLIKDDIKYKLKEENNGIIDPYDIIKLYMVGGSKIFTNKYSHILFKNGYSKDAPTIKCKIGDIRLTSPTEMTCMGRGVAFSIEVLY